MKCRSCNTRLSNAAGACPNCGHAQRAGEFIDRPGSEPSDEAADEGSARGPMPSPTGLADPADPESAQPVPVDIELDDEVELSLEEAMAPSSSLAPVEAEEVAGGSSRVSAPSSSPTFPVSLDPAQLAQLVLEQPELLEPGLGVYVDDSGVEVGAHFATEVGEIDLLARDANGAIVVVMVAGSGPGREMIPPMLHRIGWVRKHLVKDRQGVRGILVLEAMDEELGYAAAAVSDTVDFMTWRLALSFEAIDV